MQLIYPDSESDVPDPDHASSSSARDASLPLHDDSGEPELDPRSPSPSSPVCPAPCPPRSSHTRKKKPGHIPRPPNAFLIFRSELWNKEKIKSTVERDHRQISRIAGKYWQELSDVERAPYHVKAEEAKRLHALMYPDYKYTPIYRKDRAMKRKTKPEDFKKILRCERVARLMRRGFEGDDLEEELQREPTEDDYASDAASEYVETRRHRKPRKSSTKRPATTKRARRPPAAPAVGNQELMQDENPSSVEPPEPLVDDVPVPNPLCPSIPVDESFPALASPDGSHDVASKEEPFTPNIPSRPLSPCNQDTEEQAFIPQDEIPEIRLGSPACSPKVCIYTVKDRRIY